MKIKPLPRTLLNEVRLLIILLSMLITAFVAAVSVVAFSYYKLSSLESRSLSIADELESLLEVPLYNVDDESAIRVARAFLLSGKISGIELVSTATGELLSNQSGYFSERIPSISRNISGQGLELGSFTITFSDSEILDSQLMLFLFFLVIIIAVLLANIIASSYITRRAQSPFEKILLAIEDLSRGDYATQIVPTQYTDINVLVSHFNEMAKKVRTKNEEQKKAEQTLREERQFLIDIIDFLPDATFIIDKGKNVVVWNRAAEEMTGVMREEIIGKGDFAYAEPFFAQRRPMLIDLLDFSMEEVEQSYTFIRRTGKAIFAESFLAHFNDGDGVHLWGVAAPIYDHADNRTGAIEMIRDITDIKRAEEEKEKLQEQLRQNQKMESIGRLAGGIAHDFNNMLTVILGHAQLALLSVDQNTPLGEHLRIIQDTTNRSSDLVRQLLAFARRQTVAPHYVNINEAIEQTLKMLHRLIGDDILLSFRAEKEPWPVWIDPSQIDQLLINLCVNARDAISGCGKIELETANIVIDSDYCRLNPDSRPGEYLMLAITDNGCGMDRETMTHIYEPFYTTKTSGKGTGMGLATVYGIVQQNDGFINVNSEPGTGTTFRVYLPHYSGTREESQGAQVIEDINGYGETILVVEDDALILEMFSSMLKMLGYQVYTAGSPGKALDLFKEHGSRIALLITDVVMPEMNGRDLQQRLQAANKDLKCLYTSGYTSNVIAHHGVLDPDVCFLQKPFSFQELGLKVRQALL